jgi:hypothetical protein
LLFFSCTKKLNIEMPVPKYNFVCCFIWACGENVIEIVLKKSRPRVLCDKFSKVPSREEQELSRVKRRGAVHPRTDYEDPERD